MNLNKRILFVVEGADTERKNVEHMFHDILGLAEGDDFSISIYGTTFHSLIKDFFHSEIDSFPSYIKYKKIQDIYGNLLIEDGYRPNEVFSSIYLIFDFDPQSPDYNETLLEKALNTFDDETRNGLLFVNYPMFESLFDISKEDIIDFNRIRFVSIENIRSKTYKKEVNERTLFRNSRNKKIFKTLPPCYIPLTLVYNQKRHCRLLNETSFNGEELDQLNIYLEEKNLVNSKSSLLVLNTFIFILLRYKIASSFLQFNLVNK